MSDHDDGHPQRLVKLTDEVHDLGTVPAVEIAGRLIGQQQLRTIDQRPRQRRPLLLTSGEFAWPVRHSRRQPYPVQRLPRQSITLRPIHLRKAHGQFYVLHQCHAGNQIEGLKHHSHRVQAVLGQILARELR